MDGFFIGARRGILRGVGAPGLFDRMGRDLEVAGPWLVWLMIGVFVVQLLLVAENRATRDAWRDERFALTLRQLADRFENDLALGLDPIGNGHGARLVDAAYGRDPALHAVLVVDRRGTIVLDSDRGGMAGSVSPALRRVAQGADAAPWQARVGMRRIQGIAIHDAFGERVGDVMLTYPDPAASGPRLALPGGASLAAAAGTLVFACGCAAAVLARLRRGPAARAVARERAAGRRIARARLAALERCRAAEESVPCARRAT